MLLNSLSEIRQILPVGAGNDFLRLRPHMQNAETGFVLPLLGRDDTERFRTRLHRYRHLGR